MIETLRPIEQPINEGMPIYMDHQATTPMDPRVASVIVRTMTETFGNANNPSHAFGASALRSLLLSKAAIATLVGGRSENVRLTSGSTAALSLALQLARSKRPGRRLRLAALRVEHTAVIGPVGKLVASDLATVEWIEVDRQARICLSSLADVLNDDVDLVCMMAANNEVGTIYPMERVAEMVRCKGAELLVDATQAAGRMEIRMDDWGIDHLVFNAHKLYGPKGVGALLSEDANSQSGDEIAGHAGTPDVAGAAGFAEACRIMATEGAKEERRIADVRDRMEAILLEAFPEAVVNGDRKNRLAHNLHVSIPGIVNDAVVARLRDKVAIATGSACNSGAEQPSHVLLAMQLEDELLEGALRISPGRFSTMREGEIAALLIVNAIRGVELSMSGDVA